MNNSTGLAAKYDDDINKKMIDLWGKSWEKLSPKQRQLVGEILNHLNQVPSLSQVNSIFLISGAVKKTTLFQAQTFVANQGLEDV